MQTSLGVLSLVALAICAVFMPLFFPRQFKVLLQASGYVFGVGLLYVALYSLFSW